MELDGLMMLLEVADAAAEPRAGVAGQKSSSR